MGEENKPPQETTGQTRITAGTYETTLEQTVTLEQTTNLKQTPTSDPWQTSINEEQLLRNHQDTIFSSLYSDPECVLDLYFTLHPEDRNRGITSDQIKLITLENVFLAQRYNDVAFQVGNRLIVLS
ncbi:MAG: hypothetical protein K2J67_03360 [Lachnospiraceae bacterium]|nr:hypothetical protein [Lachnospiraceae bacterium]